MPHVTWWYATSTVRMGIKGSFEILSSDIVYSWYLYLFVFGPIMIIVTANEMRYLQEK